jgi:hypothetical protein
VLIALVLGATIWAASVRRDGKAIAREPTASPIELFPESSAAPAFTTEPLGTTPTPSAARARPVRPLATATAERPSVVPPTPQTSSSATAREPRPNPYR